jgi:hypothetical protein
MLGLIEKMLVKPDGCAHASKHIQRASVFKSGGGDHVEGAIPCRDWG